MQSVPLLTLWEVCSEGEAAEWGFNYKSIFASSRKLHSFSHHLNYNILRGYYYILYKGIYTAKIRL